MSDATFVYGRKVIKTRVLKRKKRGIDAGKGKIYRPEWLLVLTGMGPWLTNLKKLSRYVSRSAITYLCHIVVTL